MEQKLLTLSGHPGSSPTFSGVRVARSLTNCIEFSRTLFVLLCFFVLIIILAVLRFTASDFHFNVFKSFLSNLRQEIYVCIYIKY